MDIERLNGAMPPEIPEPLAEAAPAAGGPTARQIPAPGAGETGAMAAPSHDPGLISATPMRLPGPSLEGPGQPGPVAAPVVLPGQAPVLKFLDSRLEIAAVKGDLLGQLADPVPGLGAPAPGPRLDPGAGPGGIVFAPGIRAEQDVPPAPPQPDPGPQPDPPDPDPIPEPEGRIFGEGQWGVVTGGAVPMPGPKGGPDPVPVSVMFAPGLRAEQDVPPAPPQPDPGPQPDPPDPDPIPEPEGRIFGEGQWGVVTGGAVPMPGPKGGPDPIPDGPGSKLSLEGMVVLGHGLRAEQDVPPSPDPEPPPPPPPPDPDPTPPNPELGFLNPGLGPGSMKAQLLQELNILRAETPETLSPGNLNRAGDSAELPGSAGPQKTRIAGEDGH